MKKYEAMVLSCIDPRFQSKVYKYLKNKKLTGKYSSFTIAGAGIGVTHKKFKKWHSQKSWNLDWGERPRATGVMPAGTTQSSNTYFLKNHDFLIGEKSPERPA